MRAGPNGKQKMPLEIRSKEEAGKLIEKATEVRVVKGKGDSVKLKMRTPKALYTFKTTDKRGANTFLYNNGPVTSLDAS